MALVVRVFHGSVLDAGADGIVNAANTELRHGGGVAAAIARAAGEDFVRASEAAAPCPLGTAVATGAGRLPARTVLHVPTIDYTGAGRRVTGLELRTAIAHALRLAAERGCRSVAFPILGAGVAGFAPSTACGFMKEAFDAYTNAAGPEEVLVCAYTPGDRAAVDRVWPSASAS